MELANDGVGRGLVKASRGATTGNWPECAAGYLAAVKASHKRPSHTLRSYACSGYGCVLTQQERAKGTPETHEVLKKIANGKFNDAVHVRATAAYHLGLVRWDANERDGAARMYHKVRSPRLVSLRRPPRDRIRRRQKPPAAACPACPARLSVCPPCQSPRMQWA